MTSERLLAFLCFSCLFLVSCAVNPACNCVVYESYGESEGLLTSPNFPQIYPSNINCILYTFIGRFDEIVEITFLEFDLQVPITNKCTDFLRFFLDLERPEVNEHHQWNYEHCGNISMIPKSHYSSGRALILEFHTDSFQGNHTGFRGRYRFLNQTHYELTGGTKRSDRYPGSKMCVYDFTTIGAVGATSGRFFSPRYPQNYDPNTQCKYIFKGDSAKRERVKITFQNIQLEYIDGSCSSSPDYILVRDGVDSTAPVIAQYCNTLNGEQVISSGESLTIDLSVDGKNQRQGFAATFEFIQEDSFPQRPRPTPTSNEISSRVPWGEGNSNNYIPGDSPSEDSAEPSTTRNPSSDVIWDSTAARVYIKPSYIFLALLICLCV